jgi:SAM-dependent methyltransferase
MSDSYEATWDARPWPVTHAAPDSDSKPTAAQWGDEGLVVRRGALPRLHLAAMARVIAALNPARVLEVGAGTGRNLFVLSSRFPNIQFTGIELTEAGVAQSRALQAEAKLPALVADYCPWPDPDREAYRRIAFEQGDATALPYGDGAFDLVFTRQALEQMNMVRAPALREIARVCSGHSLHGEPFADFNRDPLRASYVAAKDYFSLPIAGLREFGLEPILTVGEFPMNITLGVGLVVARRVGGTKP